MVAKLVIEIKPRWWLQMYLKTLLLFCVLIRCEPDYEKLHNLIIKYGISQKVKILPTK